MRHNNFYGNSGLILVEPGDVTTDIYGLETGTCVWKTEMDNFGLIPPMFTGFPTGGFGYLRMEKRRVQVTPGFLVITGEFAGIPGGMSAPIYEVVFGMGEERLETHSKFVTEIAGTPSTPLNGAIFKDAEGNSTIDDTAGIFSGFKSIIGTDKNPWAGVEAYLSPDQISFRKTYYAAFVPLASNVGTIGSPAGPAPSLPDGASWIYMGFTYNQRGLIYGVQEEWRATGRNLQAAVTSILYSI